MPELPEVEANRRAILKCVGSMVVSCTFPTEDLIVCEVADLADISRAILNKKIARIDRKGKLLWIELKGSKTVILFHFGMTGAFVLKV